jgi:citrate lyase subunit beta/citryl-CoA lyase
MVLGRGPAVLFCPAVRPDRLVKAAERADVVVIDLEDAVAPGDKATARTALLGPTLDPGRTIVRVNGADTEWFADDLHALGRSPYRVLMLPKAESAQQVAALVGYQVIALCETARGVLAASQLASCPNTVGLMIGAEDLTVSLGGSSSRDGEGRFRSVVESARSQVLLAAVAAGKLALDTVFVGIDDPEGLRVESERAAASGFMGKACIHPSQVPVVRGAFAPVASQVEWARRVVAAATAHGPGAISLDGNMIDPPLVRQAERLLARHALASTQSTPERLAQTTSSGSRQ